MISIFKSVEGEPKAQPRPRSTIRHGKIKIYTPSSANQWKRAIKYSFAQLKESFPKGTPVKAEVDFYFKRPESHLKKDGSLRKGYSRFHVQKPDLDNLEKSVYDAIGDVKVWGDDCQIIENHTRKLWSTDGEGCKITLTDMSLKSEIK